MQRIIFSSKTGGGFGLQKNVDSGIIDEFGWGKSTGETAIVTFVPSNERKHFLVCCSEVSIILVSIADFDDIIDSMTRLSYTLNYYLTSHYTLTHSLKVI